MQHVPKMLAWRRSQGSGVRLRTAMTESGPRRARIALASALPTAPAAPIIKTRLFREPFDPAMMVAPWYATYFKGLPLAVSAPADSYHDK
jgi:hypothetical protein